MSERGADPTCPDRPITVLVIDDEPGMIEALTIGIEADQRFRIRATTEPARIDELLSDEVDVVLTDVRMPEVDGMTVLEQVRDLVPDVEVILMTAYSSVADAVRAVKEGAFDYVPKPFDVSDIAHKLEQASRMRRLRREVQALRTSLGEPTVVGRLLGRSAVMRRVIERVERTAGSHLSVLITGESGTGKELVARALHEQSPRRGRPFLAVNCAALPEALLESELFGHVKGAFSGAHADHAGLVAAADGGTLLLDEIGDMSARLQAELLRVLEDGEVRPVGGVTPRRVDVRFVAATHRDLQDDLAEGRFRHDLYYRINGVTIALPPLRHRLGDVPLLAQHALARATAREGRTGVRFSPAAMERLERYTWPGNVRELLAAVERAVLLCRGDVIEPRDLPDAISRPGREVAGSGGLPVGEGVLSLDAAMSRYIESVLRDCGGNVSAAAQILDIPRTTLISRMERLGLRGGDEPAGGAPHPSPPTR